MNEKIQKAYVCTHVYDDVAPVLLVSRPEGDWCFLCGAVHDDNGAAYRVVGIGHLFERDRSLSNLRDLPADWEAERADLQSSWLRTPISPTA